jgi:hypothetical protein
MKMKTVLLILAGLFLISNAEAATLYQWTDEKGGVHFTDDHTTIPPAYRDRVKSQTGDEGPRPATAPVSPPSPQKSGEDAVVFNPLSQNEGYWRDRVRPWKEKLGDAKENYETANKSYMEKSEQLSQRRFGSRTQIKMDIMELDRLNGERKKYEAQMNEAKEMLDKISKEAEEAKADPEWVK